MSKIIIQSRLVAIFTDFHWVFFFSFLTRYLLNVSFDKTTPLFIISFKFVSDILEQWNWIQ